MCNQFGPFASALNATRRARQTNGMERRWGWRSPNHSVKSGNSVIVSATCREECQRSRFPRLAPAKSCRSPSGCPGEHSEERHQEPGGVAAPDPPAKRPHQGPDHSADQTDYEVVGKVQRQFGQGEWDHPQERSPVVVREQLPREPHVGRRKAVRSKERSEDPEVHRFFRQGDAGVIEADEYHECGRDREYCLRDQQLAPRFASPKEIDTRDRPQRQNYGPDDPPAV